MPLVFCINAGSCTFQCPLSSTKRNGFSRTTGVDSILVYGGFGHSPAGGDTTPTKTMFQLEPVQLRHSLFLEIHCCCDPESTFPSIWESDIQPPLAQPWFWCNTRSPLICMRRNGAACETAHCIVPPVGATEKPSTARQKVQVALFRGKLASEWTLPVMRTASGVAPSPTTSV